MELLQSFDLQIFNFLHQIAGSGLTDFLARIFGQYLPYLTISLFILLALKIKNLKTKWHLLFWAALSIILARGLIAEIMRFFWYRARPFIELEFEPVINHIASGSFPSGHMAVLFALVLPAFLISKRFGKWFLIFAILTGIARVIAGVHWPMDIVAGAVVGIFSSLLFKFLLPQERKTGEINSI